MQLRARIVGDEEVMAFLDAALPEVYGYLLHRVRDKATAEDLNRRHCSQRCNVFARFHRIRSASPGSSASLGTNWSTIGVATVRRVIHVPHEHPPVLRVVEELAERPLQLLYIQARTTARWSSHVSY